MTDDATNVISIMGGGASSNANAVPKDAKSNNNTSTLSDQHHQLDQYEESPFDDASMSNLDALNLSSDSNSPNKKSQVATATKLKRMAFGQQSYMDQHRDYDQTLSQIPLNSTVTVDWVAPTPSPTRLVQKTGGSPDTRRPIGGEGFFTPTSTGAAAATTAFHTPGGSSSSSLKKPPPPSMRPPNTTPSTVSKHQQQVQGDPTHTAVHAPQFIRTPPPNISFPVPQQVLQNSTANFKHAIISSSNSMHSPVHNPNNQLITTPLVGSAAAAAAGATNKPLLIHKSPAADHQLDNSNSSYDDDDMIADFSSFHERPTDEVHSPHKKVPPLDLIHVSANSSSYSLRQSAHSYSNSSLKQPISGAPSLGSQSQLLAQKRLPSTTTNGSSSYPTLVNHTGAPQEGGGSSSIAATQNQRGGLYSRPPAPSISSLPAIHNSSPPLIAPVSSDALTLNLSNNNYIPQSSGGGGVVRSGATASSKAPVGSGGGRLPNIGNTPSMGGAAPPVVKETKNVKRNKAQLPTTLTHAKPTTGDWLNKRYIVNNYILLEILGTGSYGEVR